MRPRRALFLLGLCVLLAPAFAQRHHDPLNDLEIDQLREANLEPEKRLKLIIGFARARLTSLEQARSDPNTADRAQATHDWLTDFTDIYDELNENIDMYLDRKDDLRKALAAVIEGDAEFQTRLRALKGDISNKKEETRQYEFVLTSAIESVDNSIRDHRDLLKQQEEAWKNRKKKKKYE
jgi:hypothetical protein